MGKRRTRRQKPGQDSSLSSEHGFEKSEVDYSAIKTESSECDQYGGFQYTSKSGEGQSLDAGPKYSTPDEEDSHYFSQSEIIDASELSRISPIKSSQPRLSGSIFHSPIKINPGPLSTSTPIKKRKKDDEDKDQASMIQHPNIQESPTKPKTPTKSIFQIKQEVSECVTPVKQPTLQLVESNVEETQQKSNPGDSPKFCRLDLNDSGSSEEDVDANQRYKLRPRNLFSRGGVPLQRYNPYGNDSDEAEDNDNDDDDDVLFYLEEDTDNGESTTRRKSSYSGCRGPRADAKALSLVTNCPVSVKWLVDNFEYHPGKSLPRGFVYDQYVLLCDENSLEPVNAASFGKLIRSVFPGLKTRRLGTRGNSKYHYNGVYLKSKSGLRSILNLVRTQQGLTYDNNGRRGRRVRKCTEVESFKEMPGFTDGDEFIDCSPDDYLGPCPDMSQPFAQLAVDNSTIRASLEPSTIGVFEELYSIHCKTLVREFQKFDLRRVSDEWKRFWRIKITESVTEGVMDYKQAMSKITLFKVCALEGTQDFIMSMDLSTYQYIIDILFPNLARGMPITMVHGMRNLIKDVEVLFKKLMDGYPNKLAKIKLRCVRAFITMWNDYSRLNRTLKCAVHIVRSEDNIQAMKSELYRAVDFKELEEEAALHIKQSANFLMTRLILEFRDNLNHSTNLSVQGWVAWFEEVVQRMQIESQRQWADGEVTKCINPFSFWRSASDRLMGSMAKGNAVSSGVIKSFLTWCDNLTRHLSKLRVSRAEGFVLPIFYYEANLEKSKAESKFLDRKGLIPAASSTPAGRPGRLIKPNHLKMESNMQYRNNYPKTDQKTDETDVNHPLYMNLPTEEPSVAAADNVEPMQQFVHDIDTNQVYSYQIYVDVDSNLMSDSQLMAFMDDETTQQGANENNPNNMDVQVPESIGIDLEEIMN